MDWGAILPLQWVETAGLGARLDFGCVPIAPAAFHEHATTLFGLIAGVGGREEPAREPTPADLQHLQILTCLTVRQVREPGKEPEAVRFVLDEGAEDLERSRLWVGRLPLEEVAAIGGVGIGAYVEAATRAARFRRRSEAATHPGRDGEALRDDAGAVGDGPG